MSYSPPLVGSTTSGGKLELGRWYHLYAEAGQSLDGGGARAGGGDESRFVDRGEAAADDDGLALSAS